MTDTENTQKRIRRSPEERLKLMLEQQAQLAAQLKAQQKRVAERQARAHAAKVSELGELVLATVGAIDADELKAILLAARPQALFTTTDDGDAVDTSDALDADPATYGVGVNTTTY